MQEQLFIAPTSANSSHNKSKGHRPTSTPVEREWELDEDTKAIGRRGLASAREALRNALAQADENLPAAA